MALVLRSVFNPKTVRPILLKSSTCIVYRDNRPRYSNSANSTNLKKAKGVVSGRSCGSLLERNILKPGSDGSPASRGDRPYSATKKPSKTGSSTPSSKSPTGAPTPKAPCDPSAPWDPCVPCGPSGAWSPCGSYGFSETRTYLYPVQHMLDPMPAEVLPVFRMLWLLWLLP
ncbi:hypothetical protein EVAR_15922_1 [Eumeta japonica]|uniref:Uncharacterized protein n=1 Tax=Eumeta variegata TaxID=151549 RepID=A0A4C1ULF0_EUMVA|nr:hypothetical protein EVAR_15922_1 [Eumeta japonica]